MPLYLAPWTWRTNDGSPYWDSPRSDIRTGCWDLRSDPRAGVAGGTPGSHLLVLSQPDNAAGIFLGDNPESLVSAPLRRGIATALSLGETLLATTPASILLELLTRFADPTGQASWRPLRISPQKGLQLRIGNQVVYQAPFDIMSRSWANTLAVFQTGYRAMRDYDRARGSDHYLRYLTAKILEYQLGKDVLLAGMGAIIESEIPLPRQTTLLDNYNRADADALGTSSEGWSWTEVVNDIDILTNEAREGNTTSVVGRARAESDLSSDDHYAQHKAIFSAATADQAGPIVRYSAAADTGVFSMVRGATTTTGRIGKVVTGTETSLATFNETPAPASGLVAKLEVDTVDLCTLYYNALSKVTVTDATGVGNLRTGIRLDNRSATIHPGADNFEAADTAAGGAVPVFDHHYRTMRQ